MSYVIEVRGVPAPQGSKRHVGGGRMIEMSKAVGPWREAVRAEAQRAVPAPIAGPVSAHLAFRLRRPRLHYGTGRNAAVLKPGAPAWPGGKPDVDKLARAVLDGLTEGGAWEDDSQVVYLNCIKSYGEPGCTIWLAAASTANTLPAWAPERAGILWIGYTSSWAPWSARSSWAPGRPPSATAGACPTAR